MTDEPSQTLSPTITQFIEANQKLISTFAIFATLSVFANNLPDKEIGSLGNMLSFSLFTLAIFLGMEIVVNSVHTSFREGSLGSLFQSLLTLTMLLFAGFWIRTYYPYLVFLLLMAVGLAVVLLVYLGFQWTIRRMISSLPILRGKSQRMREEFIPVFGAMFIMVLLFIILPHIKSIVWIWKKLF
jgi:uncharacterized membrane protein